MTQMNMSMKQKQTHRYNRLQASSGTVGWGKMDWEFAISRYKLLYIP